MVTISFLSQASPQGEELKSSAPSGLRETMLLLLRVCFSIKRFILPSGLFLLLIAWRLLLTTGRMRPWLACVAVAAQAPPCSTTSFLSCLLCCPNLPVGSWAGSVAHCACVLVSAPERRRCVSVCCLGHVRGSRLRVCGGGAGAGWGCGLLWSPFCWLHYWVIRALARCVRRIPSARGQVRARASRAV